MQDKKINLPFTETSAEGIYIRVFKEDVDESELVWHTDPEDRIVEAVHKTDWKVQLDDSIPTDLNKPVFITKGVWHRVIKGTGDLCLRLKKLN